MWNIGKLANKGNALEHQRIQYETSLYDVCCECIYVALLTFARIREDFVNLSLKFTLGIHDRRNRFASR
jgi:hypothetical protein